MLQQTAICERSGKAVKLSEGWLAARPGTGEWLFISVDDEISSDYCVPVRDLAEDPDKWKRQLHQKTWFDAEKFKEFIERLIRENKLVGTGLDEFVLDLSVDPPYRPELPASLKGMG